MLSIACILDFCVPSVFFFFFFFNDTATTEIYTLSLHDALPIYPPTGGAGRHDGRRARRPGRWRGRRGSRSEEHTSELQSLAYLVCRLLLEKKKKTKSKVDIKSTKSTRQHDACAIMQP